MKYYPTDVDRDQYTFAVNLSTPEDYKYWAPLKEWIETSPIKVVVSTAYGWCDDAFKTPESLGIRRGGFLFMFWFNNREDAQEFADTFKDYCWNNRAVVIEDAPQGSENLRGRVMDAAYSGEKWYEDGIRRSNLSQAAKELGIQIPSAVAVDEFHHKLVAGDSGLSPEEIADLYKKAGCEAGNEALSPQDIVKLYQASGAPVGYAPLDLARLYHQAG